MKPSLTLITMPQNSCSSSPQGSSHILPLSCSLPSQDQIQAPSSYQWNSEEQKVCYLCRIETRPRASLSFSRQSLQAVNWETGLWWEREGSVSSGRLRGIPLPTLDGECQGIKLGAQASVFNPHDPTVPTRHRGQCSSLYKVFPHPSSLPYSPMNYWGGKRGSIQRGIGFREVNLIIPGWTLDAGNICSVLSSAPPIEQVISCPTMVFFFFFTSRNLRIHHSDFLSRIFPMGFCV